MADRVAIITGGGSGIGAACARALTADGFTVVLAGRRRDKLDEIVAQGSGALAVTTDVSDEASVVTLFDTTRSRFGRVDLLFNNAGVFGAGGPIEDITLDDWNRSLATNVTGTFLCTREAVRVMKAQTPMGGRIINNGSISAHAPRPDSVGYTSTKHAITGLTKSTSLDGRKYQIACGQIDIGNASTGLLPSGPMPQADGERRVEPTMDVADVAHAVSYMAGLPLSANVQFLTVMATAMPFVGRG